MFGIKGDQNNQMVKKHEWVKLDKKLKDMDVQTKLEVAAACGNSTDEEASHFLIKLLKDTDESVQIQAVKSLGTVGSSNAKTNLQWFSDHLPEGSDKIKAAVKESIAAIGSKK
jgi:HEAT repeat protein